MDAQATAQKLFDEWYRDADTRILKADQRTLVSNIATAISDARAQAKREDAAIARRKAEQIPVQWAAEYRGTGAFSWRDSKELAKTEALKDIAKAIEESQ